MTWRNDPFQMRFRVIEGLTVRFAQSEDRDDHALLLSPWPESLLAFEPMWARLAEHTHLVAIDLPGFGHSQRRDALLAPRAMGRIPHPRGRRLRARPPARHRARHGHRGRTVRRGRASGPASQPCGGQRGHDGSAPAGRMAERLGRSPRPRQFRRADPRPIVAGALADIERYALPDSVREDYLSSYQGNRFAESMRYLRSYPSELPVLVTCCRRSRHRCRSSPARMTRRYRRRTPTFLASAAASQQARHDRRGPLHLGRRRRRVRGSRHQLVGRRLRRHGSGPAH